MIIAKSNKALRNVSVLLTLLLLLCSCGSSKKLTSSESATRVEGNSLAPEENFRQLVGGYGNWQRLKVPVNVSVTSPAAAAVSGQAIMERGKSISLSMRVLGMEVANLYVSADTALLVDRWNKRYFCENLSRFLAGFPVGMYNLQDILLGRVFVLGNESVTAADVSAFKFDRDEDVWGMAPRSLPRGVEYAFVLTARKLISVVCTIDAKAPVQISYGDPVSTPAGEFAASVGINAPAGKKKVDAVIEWKWNKASWNADVNPPSPRIPAGYKKMNISDLLKSSLLKK